MTPLVGTITSGVLSGLATFVSMALFGNVTGMIIGVILMLAISALFGRVIIKP